MHAAKAPASSLHSNVEPDSLEAKPTTRSSSSWGLLGPDVIVVSGGVVSPGMLVSIVHVHDAGDASVLPDESVARTLNVCEPALSPV